MAKETEGTESTPALAPPTTPTEWGSMVDKLLTRGGGSALVILAVWMNTTLTTMRNGLTKVQQSITKVTTELGIVSPRDLQVNLHTLRANMLTEDAVENIVRKSAPWLTDKPIFEKRMSVLEERIRELERKK